MALFNTMVNLANSDLTEVQMADSLFCSILSAMEMCDSREAVTVGDRALKFR